jgi:hypothetical protein
MSKGVIEQGQFLQGAVIRKKDARSQSRVPIWAYFRIPAEALHHF